LSRRTPPDVVSTTTILARPFIEPDAARATSTPSRLARHARLRHDGRDPASRECHAAPKNEPPKDDVKDRKALSPLIRWSVQEIRRIAIRLAQRRINPAHVIAWSIWRRVHQAIARKAHIKRNMQL
jgi:hypothetical protein